MTITRFRITPGIRINCRCSRSPSHQTLQVQGVMDCSSSTRERTTLIQGRGSSDQKSLATCAQVSKNGCAVSARKPMTNAMNGWGRETHPPILEIRFFENTLDSLLALLAAFNRQKQHNYLSEPFLFNFCVKLKNRYFNNLTVTNPTMFHLRRERLAGLVTVTKGGWVSAWLI